MMSKRPVDLIGYCCDWGARDKGAAQGPQHCVDGGLVNVLQDQGWQAAWMPLLTSSGVPPSSSLPSASERRAWVDDYGRLLSEQVEQALKQQHLPFVIGGDHTSAMATWPAVAKVLGAKKQLGLIWIDAHCDAHTPETSVTKNLHGMPLSFLLNSVIAPEHLCLLGVRSFEAAEQAFLQAHGVKIFYMDAIRRQGFSHCFQQALAWVNRASVGFGISLDIDAFDPSIAPGTGYHESNGLLQEEVCQALAGVFYHPKLLAFEIAEYNPRLDVNNKTLALIRACLVALMSQQANGGPMC